MRKDLGQCEHRYRSSYYDAQLGDFRKRCGSFAQKDVDGRKLCSVHAWEARQTPPVGRWGGR